MKSKTKGIIETLDNIRFDHAIWLSEVLYSLQEVKLYENRLLNLIEIYFGKEEQEVLGEMLQKFGYQKKTLNHIKKTIQIHVENMKTKVNANGELKSLVNSDHKKAREMINSFRTSYATLKEQFHHFADAQY